MLHNIRSNRNRRIAIVLGLALLMIGLALKINHRVYADVLLLSGAGVLFCIGLLILLHKTRK
jgi:hypothetical protein